MQTDPSPPDPLRRDVTVYLYGHRGEYLANYTVRGVPIALDGSCDVGIPKSYRGQEVMGFRLHSPMNDLHRVAGFRRG